MVVSIEEASSKIKAKAHLYDAMVSIIGICQKKTPEYALKGSSVKLDVAKSSASSGKCS